MKDNPEVISALTALVGSVAKAIKIKLSWRKGLASAILATMIGYVLPGLIATYLPDASKEMMIAVSILVGFSMHGLIDVSEEILKDKVKGWFGVDKVENENKADDAV